MERKGEEYKGKKRDWMKPTTKHNQNDKEIKGKNDEVNGEGEECGNTLPKRKYNNNNINNNNNNNKVSTSHR